MIYISIIYDNLLKVNRVLFNYITMKGTIILVAILALSVSRLYSEAEILKLNLTET